MEIDLSDFRCFYKATSASIRPLTILVGENSTGKTSFLAATRFLFDLFHREAGASFNKDPFHLGSYDDIAHLRSGPSGRSRNFQFSVRGTAIYPRKKRAETGQKTTQFSFLLHVHFIEKRSLPFIKEFSFSANGYELKLTSADETALSGKTPAGDDFTVKTDFIPIFGENGASNLSYIVPFLRIAFQIKKIDDSGAEVKLTDEIDTLLKLYEAAISALPTNVFASAPVRSRPERTYNPTDFSTVPDGAHIPFVLAQLSSYESEKWAEIRKSIAEFGQLSGLFQDVHVRRIGKSGGAPFQLIVTMGGRKSNIIDVGYGVNQILPLIADLLRAPRRSMFLFQQPEVHLHPRAQAQLGSFLMQMVKQRSHTIFVETHSDYLLDRIRMLVRDDKSIKPADVGVLFFDRNKSDVTIHNISFDKAGNINGTPPNYRDFFLKEELNSLGVQL